MALTSTANFFAFMIGSFMVLPDVAKFAKVRVLSLLLRPPKHTPTVRYDRSRSKFYCNYNRFHRYSVVSRPSNEEWV